MTDVAEATSAPGPRRPGAAIARAGWPLGQSALILIVLFVLLDGRHRDFRVPLHFSADALEYLMQVKGTIDRGWWWVHPRLSAPSTFAQLSYPSNTTVDQTAVWLVHRFADGAGLVLNATWMLLVAVSGVVATWGFRRLGLSRAAAMGAGTLYALSPYALSRNIEHFSLVTYLVPVPCVAALLVATGRIGPLRWRPDLGLAFGCLLVGLNYTYYAFFAVFLLGIASLIAMTRGWRDAAWRRGTILAGVIVIATAINLVPSWRVWAREGEPLVIPEKTAAESETYGLKIRQLVSPVLDHTVWPLSRWNTLETRAKFPLETENSTSRLGLIATIGFLALLAILLLPRVATWFSDSALPSTAAKLTIALILLGTVGGFGSLFSLLVTPDIRSYNRVYPFIAYYAWLIVGLVVDTTFRQREGHSTRFGWIVASGLLALGVYDQGHAAAPLNRELASNRDEWTELSTFVHTLESRLPSGTMVFQLPLTTYLNDRGEVRMRPYDEIKPYLVSSSVHWSYPALGNAVVRWQHAVARLSPPAMAASLDTAGFAAILIDRDGYEDAGASVIRDLFPNGTDGAVLAETPRYIALSLQRADKSGAGMARLPAWSGTFAPATAGLASCGHPASANLDSVGGVKVAPSRPMPLESGGTIVLRGWAIDERRSDLAGDVDVAIDGASIATFYGVDRPDIATRYTRPRYRYSGFVTHLDASRLTKGPHQATVRVLSADRGCFTETTPVTIVR